MQSIIAAIGGQVTRIEDLGVQKAKALTAYDKAMAIQTLELRPDHPVTILERIVKGECENEMLEKSIAESAYKSCITIIEARKAQLNALQSLFKQQEDM